MRRENIARMGDTRNAYKILIVKSEGLYSMDFNYLFICGLFNNASDYTESNDMTTTE
jgi:hypothetical protein